MSVEHLSDPTSSDVAEELEILSAAAARLAAHPLWEVQSAALAGLLRGVEAAGRMLDSARLRLVAEVDDRGVALSDGAVSTGRWVADVTGATPSTGVRSVSTAAALARRFRPTAAALASGAIGLWHAERIVAALDAVRPRVEPTALDEAEAHLLALVGQLDTRGFVRACATMAAVLDPDGPAPDDEDSAHRNALRISEATSAGMRRVTGWLDDTSAAVLLSALTPLAAPGGLGQGARGGGANPDGLEGGGSGVGEDVSRAAPQRSRAAALDRRGAPRRMADALLALAKIALASDLLPHQGGARPAVTVTIDLAVLRGDRSGVGTLDWGGPVSAATARLLACDSRVVPVVLGGAGQPLDVGRERRTVPTAARRALVVRDDGCAFPGCGAPPGWCDAHHIEHWADGGATDLANLVLLCGAHHRLTHASGWGISIDAKTGHPRFRPPRHVDPQQRWRPSHNAAGRLRT